MEAPASLWTPFDDTFPWLVVHSVTPSVWTTPSDFAVSGTAAPAIQTDLNLTSDANLTYLLANNGLCGGEYAYEYNEANYTEYAVAELSVVGAFAGVMSLPSSPTPVEDLLAIAGLAVAGGAVYFAYSDLVSIHQQC